MLRLPIVGVMGSGSEPHEAEAAAGLADACNARAAERRYRGADERNVVRNRNIASRIAGLAVALGLSGLPFPSSAYGRPDKPRSAKKGRFDDVSRRAMAVLAGRSFEFWADREVGGSGGCETPPESEFQSIPPKLMGAVAFSKDGRAVVLTLAGKFVTPTGKTARSVSLPCLTDGDDGSAVYESSTNFLSLRVSVDGSPERAELKFFGSGLCVTGWTRGTLRELARAPDRRERPNVSDR
jgi:hypothetical protein